MAQCKIPKAFIGYGAILQYWDNTQDDWITVGGTQDLEFPEITDEKVETNEDDGDGTMHYTSSPQLDLSDPAYEVDFFEDQHKKLMNIKLQRPTPVLCWRIVMNTTRQFYFQWCGFIMALSAAIPKRELVKSNITIGYSGGMPDSGFLNA